jgi:hypothetical protein
LGTFSVRDMAASIFISYAHEDRARAEQFAARFAAAGWSVWWDRQITGGRHFDMAAEEAIAAAKIVLVLWSRASAASHWVRAEAAWALEKHKLLPVKIEDVDPPLQFFHVQTIDLAGWSGRGETPSLAQLLSELAQALGVGRPRLSASDARRAIDRPRGVDPQPRSGDRASVRSLPSLQPVAIGPTLRRPQRLPLALLGAVLATLIIFAGYVVLVGDSTPITKPGLLRTPTANAGSPPSTAQYSAPALTRSSAPAGMEDLPSIFKRP